MQRAEARDYLLVKLYILIPFIVTAFEHDSSIISLELRTPAPYLEALHSALNAASADLRAIRAEMRTRGLRIYEQNWLAAGAEVRFICRGYHERILLLDDVISVEATMQMRRYLGLDTAAGPLVPLAKK
ncbi:hypothetical protein [Paenibacillus sp. MMS20-IR301]|uniref:hypothetical protein n=1 Tax=Paenibacillus sp. MMS20-IR301 TaxID=2895946 RepID=UPI0028F13FB1|nr:hypothetical protein [Paenibacillus sp. MMS20-IR301]WNS41774.1 hypothetical protein LOS79_22530 [Paenibacillus sp. MMS20-IR301]